MNYNTYTNCDFEKERHRIPWEGIILRGCADKSLARPGKKEAITTKLGIYLTYSPRSSIQFLAHCSKIW